VSVEALEADKRPVSAVADHFEFRSVHRVDIAMDRSVDLVMLRPPPGSRSGSCWSRWGIRAKPGG